MEGETINVIDNLVEAIKILNKTDEYLESLNDGLSECDSLISDYEHFIENMDIEKVDIMKLFNDMKSIFNKRRIIKENITLRDNYKNLSGRLNNTTNREFLIQNLKNVQSKLGTKYHNRILKQDDIENLKVKETIKRGPGRPRKNEVIENV